MSASYNLERFVQAQDYVIDTVLTELKKGCKQSHWMWFVFPQLKGLGRSSTSHFYGISGISEAIEYVKHPILWERYNACLNAVLQSGVNNPVKIFGHTDSQKFLSSLTLFSYADKNNELINKSIQKFYSGITDYDTEKLLNV